MLKPAKHVFRQHVLQIKKRDSKSANSLVVVILVGLCLYTIDQTAIMLMIALFVCNKIRGPIYTRFEHKYKKCTDIIPAHSAQV